MKCYKLTILVIFIFICSCSKKSDNIQPVPPPVTNLSTTVLKIYEIDSTKPVPNDTISKWSFTYDNLNRIISDSFFNTTNYGSKTFLDVATFSYNNNDTFCARKVHDEFLSSSLTASDTTFFEFTDGKCSRDSVVYYYPTALFTYGSSKAIYSYQEGVVIRHFESVVPQASIIEMESDTIHQTFTNGAISHQIDTTFFSYNNGGSSPPQIFSTSISYLTNPNPFYKIYLPFHVSYISQIGIGDRYSEHNIYAPQYLISQQSSSLGDISYSYTFRSDGYPLTALVTSNASGTSKTTKLVFVYKE